MHTLSTDEMPFSNRLVDIPHETLLLFRLYDACVAPVHPAAALCDGMLLCLPTVIHSFIHSLLVNKLLLLLLGLFFSLLGHERPGWCYPTGRCAYLPSVTFYRQVNKNLLLLLLLLTAPPLLRMEAYKNPKPKP